MFGLSGIGLKIAIILALSGAATGGWFYVQNLRGELALAAERQARLTDVVDSQKQAMETIQRDIGRMQAATSELNKKLVEAEQGRRELENKFNQTSAGRPRDFAALANKEPDKIEESINRGTRDAHRCNEIVSGSDLTADEQAGKVRNTMCSNLLPAYKGPPEVAAAPQPAASAPVASKPTTPSKVVVDSSKIKRARQ